MEPVHGELIASECEVEDFISSMPDNVITEILNLLPVRDAVSTSIFSRTWRYKWTLITKLVFDDDDLYDNLRGRGGKPSYKGNDLSRLIDQLKGPITKFDLDIPNDMLFDDEDFNHWLSVVSRKGIKELNIFGLCSDAFELPTQLFSCLELKHLLLHNCFFNLPPSFCGFPKLLNLELSYPRFEELELSYPRFERSTFGELIARCPLLEALIIDDDDSVEDMEVAEIAKSRNLKILDLSLCVFESITSSSIFHLADLPKLEELTLYFYGCKVMAEGDVKKKVPSAFLSLETLNLGHVDFNNHVMVSFVSEVICSSPNLLNLDIRYTERSTTSTRADPDYNTMGMLQLRNVWFSTYFEVSENEVRYIKSLLACTPLLENFVIRVRSSRMLDGENGKLMFTTMLLNLPRASPMAEVNVCWK